MCSVNYYHDQLVYAYINALCSKSRWQAYPLWNGKHGAAPYAFQVFHSALGPLCNYTLCRCRTPLSIQILSVYLSIYLFPCFTYHPHVCACMVVPHPHVTQSLSSSTASYQSFLSELSRSRGAGDVGRQGSLPRQWWASDGSDQELEMAGQSWLKSSTTQSE